MKKFLDFFTEKKNQNHQDYINDHHFVVSNLMKLFSNKEQTITMGHFNSLFRQFQFGKGHFNRLTPAILKISIEECNLRIMKLHNRLTCLEKKYWP